MGELVFKEREFIEDLEALCRQYWGKEVAIILTKEGLMLRWPKYKLSKDK